MQKPVTCGAGLTYDRAMGSSQASTSLSVRGEAQRTTAPDEARVFSTLSATAGSKAAAVSDVRPFYPASWQTWQRWAARSLLQTPPAQR